MRELIIIILILLIIIISGIYIDYYLSSTTKVLVDSLNFLKNSLNSNKEDDKRLEEVSEEIYAQWKDINKNWSNIILHEEIDAIETSLIRVKTKIKEKEYDEVLEEIEISIFLVNHIKEKEKMSLKNIF